MPTARIALAQVLRKRGIDAGPIGCDVGDHEAVRRLAAYDERWRGRVDILVCNAGI